MSLRVAGHFGELMQGRVGPQGALGGMFLDDVFLEVPDGRGASGRRGNWR